MRTPNETAMPTDDSSLPLMHGKLAEFSADVLGGLLGLHERFGPVAGLQDGPLRVLFAFDPRYNKQVLSDPEGYHTRFFAIRGPKRSSQRRVTCGLFDMNGEQWRRNRRLLKEPLGLKQIATYRATIARLAEEFAAAWQPGTELDLGAEMVRFMLAVNSMILFGMGDTPDERRLAYEVGEQIAEWAELNHDLGIGALVPDAEFSVGYERLLAFSKGLEARVLAMIERRRADSSAGDDVLSILVRTHDEAGGMSEEELIGQTCVLFAAAHMTTANTLTWTLLLLAQLPELRRQVGEHYQAHGIDAAGRPDPMSLPERVIRESMRLMPASSYSQRLNTRPIDLGPFRDVPPKTPIVFSPLVTHRLGDLYDKPTRFDPERWLRIKPSPYEYLPLGAGPRMCVGGPLALEVIRTALPRFLNGTKLRAVPGSEVTAQVKSTVLQPVGEVPVAVLADDGGYEAVELKGNVWGGLVAAPG